MAVNPETPEPPTGPRTVEASLELGRRVLYTMLEPAVRLAFTLGVSMKELIDWLQMAYFHEAKRNGLKVKEMASLMDVTPRTVTSLSQRLKVNFLSMCDVPELERRMEFVLWAGPLSEVRLCNALPDEDAAHVKEALTRLVSSGRVVRENGRTVTYRIARHQVRLPRDTLLARIDGLSNLLGSVTNAVFGRFFRNEPKAFARTITLRVRQGDIEALTAIYEEVWWEKLVQIDQAAAEDPEAETVDLSIVWAPYEYLQNLWSKRG